MYYRFIDFLGCSVVPQENVLVCRKFALKYLEGTVHHISNLLSNGSEEKILVYNFVVSLKIISSKNKN